MARGAAATRHLPDVLIASSSRQVRGRWRQALDRDVLTHELGERRALVRTMACIKPDVLLLDLALTEPNSPGSVRALRRASPRSKIIAFSNAFHERQGISVLRAGAKGYCNKNIGLRLLGKAVRRVQKGDIWAGRGIVRQLLTELFSTAGDSRRAAPVQPSGLLQRLTARERQIAYLVSGGASNKEISNALGLAEKTVKAHLTAIFKKVGLRDRLRLALLVNRERRPAPHRPVATRRVLG